MKNKHILFLFLFVSTICFAQKKITWENLAQVKFSEKFFEDEQEWYLYPEFYPSLQALEGQQITLTGFFLDIDPKANLHVLSKNPMASCFFCGGAGPETAVELQYSNPEKFKTDDIITVTGTLSLNKDDIEHFNYILTNCTATLTK